MNQTVEKRLDGASVGDWIRNNTNLLLMRWERWDFGQE